MTLRTASLRLTGPVLFGALLLLPALAHAESEQKHTASLGASAGAYYLRVTGDNLKGANAYGLTLLPELRYSYTLAENWQGYGTLRWTGMSNVTQQKKIDGAAESKAPVLFSVGISRSFKLEEDEREALLSLWAPKVSLSLGYGNFKVGADSWVTGALVMLSVDADFLRVRF